MKNVLILFSILLLSACGGGSGGAKERVRVTPIEPTYIITTQEVRDSNGEVTNMISETHICKNCQSPRVRVSTNEQMGNQTFDVYDLSDVTFTMADEGFEPGKESFVFVIDTNKDSETRGKIIGIDMGMRQKEEHPEHEPGKTVDADFVRTEKNKFHGYVKHDSENSINGYSETDFTYNSMGKKKHVDLKYSDFGNISMDIKENWNPVFIGGYDVKKIAPQNIKDPKKEKETFEFSGRAVGYVAAHTNGTDNASIKPLDADATLVFSNNTSTLNADFDNWYDIIYTEQYDKDGNIITKNIDFSNFTADEEKYKFLNDKTHFSNETYTEGGETLNALESDIRYFGDNTMPIEAVGLIQVRDCANNQCGGIGNDIRSNEIRMNLGFGVETPKEEK